ncbi:WD40-repeat-containing domain protein [Mycena rebaudengoi]|nr:WD40-repeat-containing domain protein [Mycena rebaudengoi]
MSPNSAHFSLVQTLKGHTDSINVISFSPDSKFLASGGDDGLLQIFDTKTWKTIRKFRGVSAIRALVWHSSWSGALMVGSRNGDINTIQMNKFTGKDNQWKENVMGPVHCMALRDTGNALAIGCAERVIVVHQTSLSSWGEEISLPIPNHLGSNLKIIAQSLVFLTKEKTLLVLYEQHGIIAYHSEDPTMQLWNIEVSSQYCGQLALSPNLSTVAVTNLQSGIDFYSLHTRTHSAKTRQQLKASFNVIVPVVFIDKDTIAVGSGTGEVAIYKQGERVPLQILHHEGEMVQTLDHRRIDNNYYLVTGISEQYDECNIRIWKAKDQKNRSTTAEPDELPSSEFLHITCSAFFIVLLFAGGIHPLYSGFVNHVVPQMQSAIDWARTQSFPTPWVGTESVSKHDGIQRIVTVTVTKIQPVATVITKRILETSNHATEDGADVIG